MANTCPFIAPCPHLFRPHKTLQSPKCQGDPPPCCFTPLCVWFCSIFPPALATFTPFLQPFPDLLELPCSSWNASTTFPQEKGLQTPQGFFLNSWYVIFQRQQRKRQAQLSSVPTACQQPSIPSAHNTNSVSVIPAAHSSCLLCHCSCSHVVFAGLIIQWAQHAAVISSSSSINLQCYKFPIVSHTDFKDLLVVLRFFPGLWFIIKSVWLTVTMWAWSATNPKISRFILSEVQQQKAFRYFSCFEPMCLYLYFPS